MVRGNPSIYWCAYRLPQSHPRAGGDPFSSLDLRCVYGTRPVVGMALGPAGTPSPAS